MTDPLDGAFLELQRGYLASMPARLQELRSDLDSFRKGGTEAAGSLKARLHRLAGSGGSFGFLELSAIAREGERWLASGAGPEPDGLPSIVDRLGEAARNAEAQLSATTADRSPNPIPRALLILRPSPQRERIAQELRNAGYQVRFANRQDDPGATPLEELPHLIVIGGEAGDGDPSAIASAWTNN